MADGLAASTEDVKGGGLDKLRYLESVVLLMMVCFEIRRENHLGCIKQYR